MSMEVSQNWALCYYGASTLILYLASIAVYRLYFHPLAAFPGPSLAAMTRWYEAYYDVVQDGQYIFQIGRLHERYGPIVRISPFELHVNDPSFYEQLYRQEGIWDKYKWMNHGFAAGHSSTFLTVGHALHRRRRAALNPYFSSANVAKRQYIIQTHTRELSERIRGEIQAGSTFDLGDALSATSIDIATDYIVGRSYKCLESADFNRGITNMIRAHGEIWRRSKHIPFVGPAMVAMPLKMLEVIANPEGREFISYLRNSKSQTKEIMAQITSNENTREDESDTLIHAILRSEQLPPSEKEFGRVHQELDSVKGAGFETVAQTLRFTIFQIYSDPMILHRVRSELSDLRESLVSTNACDDPSKGALLTRMERLPYLTSVIKEGLRMSPGVAARLTRIAPDRDLAYGSWIIPAGTPIAMTVLLLHYSESQYLEPHKFQPERWMGHGQDKVQGSRVFAPFSRGPRMCVGMHLAWAELYIIIATLVSSFDIAFVDANVEDVAPSSDQFVIGTGAKHGPKARAKVWPGEQYRASLVSRT